MVGKTKTSDGQSRHRPRYRIAVAACVMWLLAVGYRATPLERWVEERVSFPFYFLTRQWIQAAPPLDPRLKIYAFDDTTLSRLKRPSLHLGEWVKILTALDKRRPRAIVIDQIFAIPPEHPGFEENATSVDVEAARDLVAAIARLRAPILSAAFVTDRRRPGAELDLSQPIYRLESYFPAGEATPAASSALVQRPGWHAYGPNELVKSAFRQVGHVLNAGRGHAQAVIALSPTTVVPHMTLLGANGLTIEHGRLRLDGKEMPTSSQGEIVVDFLRPADYYARSRRLIDLLRRVEAGRSIDAVEPGDIVLLIPASFTGHADFAETPVGLVPGGFVHASMLNSRLRGAWLEYQPAQALLELVMAGLGALLYSRGIFAAMGLLACGSIAWVGACLAIFVLRSELIGLSSTLLAFVATGFAAIALNGRVQEAMRLVVRLLREENIEMRAELTQAGEIARVLLPARTPDWEGVSVGLHHTALSDASGDWYAFEASPSGRLLHFIMCDITGHGVQAAIIVSTCKAVLSVMVRSERAAVDQIDFISRYATLLNHTLVRNGKRGHTTTLVGVTFDRERQTMHVLCAAHPRPVLLPAGKPPVLIGNAHDLLGLDDDKVFAQTEHPFGPGDMLVVHTDGISMPRKLTILKDVVEKLSHQPPAMVARQVAMELERRRRPAGDGGVDDDACLAIFVAGERSRDATGPTDASAA